MSVIDNLLKWNDEYELAGMVIELRGTRDELQAENERLTAEVKRVNAILVDAVEEFDTICKKKDDELARLTVLVDKLKEDGDRLAGEYSGCEDGYHYCVHCDNTDLLGAITHSKYCPITLHRALMAEIEREG